MIELNPRLKRVRREFNKLISKHGGILDVLRADSTCYEVRLKGSGKLQFKFILESSKPPGDFVEAADTTIIKVVFGAGEHETFYPNDLTAVLRKLERFLQLQIAQGYVQVKQVALC